MNYLIAKTKVLISCAGASDLHLFSHMQKNRFSHDLAQIL